MEGEYDTYERNGDGKKKGEMKSQLSEAENNKLILTKTEIERADGTLPFYLDDWAAHPCQSVAPIDGTYHRRYTTGGIAM